MKPRKTHRSRFSITHLSSETTATLPEYVPPSPKHAIHSQRQRISAAAAVAAAAKMLDSELEGPPSDQPPEYYPDSADEADEETDFAPGNEVYHHGTPLPSSAAPVVAPFPRRFHSTSNKRYSSSLSPPGRYASNNNYHQHYHYTHPHRYQPPLPVAHHHSHRPRRFKPAAVHPYSLSSSPTDDPYLDSLLERSVHALEMSNTLLQSSISTPQTSQSAQTKTPSLDEAGDSQGSQRHMEEEVVMDKFEERAKGLTKRIDMHEKRREQWVDDLEKITQDAERLFGDGDPEGDREFGVDDSWEAGSSGGRGRHRWQNSKAAGINRQSGISCSLPTPSSMPVTLPSSSKEEPHAPWLTLPSTLGTRTLSTSVHHPSASTSAVSLHSSPLMPQVTDKLPEPTTPAYNMLASFVQRTPTGISSTPSSFSNPSVLASLMPKMRPRASSSIPAMENPRSKCRLSIDNLRSEPITRSSSAESSSSRRIPKSPLIHRPMTPPIEESSPSAGSSSSSSESLIAKQTVLTLRKILDEQPRIPARSTVSLDAHGKTWRLKAPVFMPVSPPPAPQASTSNATASISRLFTKAIHSSSTRQPSPVRSALKHGTGSRTSIISGAQQIQPSASSSSQTSNSAAEASTSKTVLNGKMNMNINVAKAQIGLLPELLSAGVARAFGAKTSGSISVSTSGRSTPKRISFAELPDMQSSSDGGRRSSRFKEKQARRKKKRGREEEEDGGENDGSGSGGGYDSSLRDALESGSPPLGGGWWSGWLGGDAGGGGIEGALTGMAGGSGGMYASRLEDRTSRPWSSGDWVM